VLSSRGSSICALDSPGASSVACGGAATGCSPITPGAHGRCGPPTTACEPRRARNRCAGWCCSPERAALATSLSWQDCVERIGQALQARGYVLELIESEQADSKAPVVGAFVALERNPGGDLQAVVGKLPAVLNLGIRSEENTSELHTYLFRSPERASLATSLSWQDCVERIVQSLQSLGYVLELIESEQADSKAPVVGAFVALERNPGGDLQAVGGKLPAVLNLGI